MARTFNYIFCTIAFVLLPVAASAFAPTFPISELGGCADRGSCRTYCDMPEHMSACAHFAARNDLSAPNIEVVTALSRALLDDHAPGSCKTMSQCLAYCNDAMHLEECIAFAHTVGIDTDSLDDVQKTAAYLKSGGMLPGGCDSQETCASYCLDVNHISECVAFGMNIGVIPGGKFASSTEVSATSTMPEEKSTSIQQATTTQQDRLTSSSGTVSATEEIPADALVAPEVFRFASFPDDAALCLKERMGADAEERVADGSISQEELRTVVESCLIEILSANHEVPMDELLESADHDNVSFLRTFSSAMFAMPLKVGDYLLHLLSLKS
jgi:hypothetical protein